MAQRRDKPYIWVTWLTKLLVGENHCEWAAWFKANHDRSSYAKMPSSFDATAWQLEHTDLLARVRSNMESEGKVVTTEAQNAFTLTGRTAVLGGKPDLVTVSGQIGTIVDVKTGTPSAAHHVQVMLYMYALPLALPRYRGVVFDGRIEYLDHDVQVPPDAIDETFTTNLTELIRRLAAPGPPRAVPSVLECGFCDITASDCTERTEAEESDSGGETNDF